MQNSLPKTFCPAKWDELILNLNYNYAYSCCKASPVKFERDYKKIINEQKQNLLNGIQDQSCEYCWAVENNNKTSLRQTYLETFDSATFDQYLNLDKSVRILEINLGNACNMQCQYCNPKFSSEWEKDIRKQRYPVFSDRFFYDIEDKNNNVSGANLSIIENIQPKVIRIIGGEPLINNNFWRLLDTTETKRIKFSSNFMVDLSVIERLLEYEKKFDQFELLVSLDSTKELAEFVRYGLNFNVWVRNLEFYLTHSTKSSITIISLMTSITILNLQNFSEFIIQLRKKFLNKNIIWLLNNCVNPKIQSFATLPLESRKDILVLISTLHEHDSIIGLDGVISQLENTSFDPGLSKQLKYFIDEWEKRKNISLSTTIKQKLWKQI